MNHMKEISPLYKTKSKILEPNLLIESQSSLRTENGLTMPNFKCELSGFKLKET